MRMAKELVGLAGKSLEIKQYLNDNEEIFANILDKSLVDVPGVNKLDKKELYNIFPSMLNHPEELVKIIEGVESGNYKNVAGGIYNLYRKTNYFEGQLSNLAKAGAEIGLNYTAQTVTNIFSNASQEVVNKITDSNILIEQAVDKVFLQAQSEGKQGLPDKKKFTQQIKTLCSENPELKDYIVEKLNSNPINSVGDVSSPKINQYKHATNHINSPVQVLKPLYENIINKEDIKNNLIANIISEQVSQKLFGKGDNRGEDYHMIHQMLKQVVSDYAKANHNSIDNFLEPENQKILANNIVDTLKSKSRYNLAGFTTGGIYLPKEIFNKELKNSLKKEFNNNIPPNILVEAKNIYLNNKFNITENKAKSNSNTSPPLVNKNKQKDIVK